MSEFLQQLVNGISQGSIYALIALGYTMVFGVLRFINFAHGDVYMLGAFSGLFLGRKALEHMESGAGLLLTGAVLLLTMVACALVGIVIEILCYRPLRERPKLTVLITAIGVSLLLENGGQWLLGAAPQAFPDILANRPLEIPANWGALSDVTITIGEVLIISVTLVLLLVLCWIVLRTRMGMAMRALSFNPTASALMGVNNNVIISFTFGLGSALAGAAGILTSLEQPSIDPLMGINAGLKAFIAAVLGGIGNLPGAALGGLLIGLLEALIGGYGGRISEDLPTYRDPIVFGVLILVLILRPAGLLGAVTREKV